MNQEATECLKYIQENIDRFIWIIRYTNGKPRISKYELKCLLILIDKNIDHKLDRKTIVQKVNEMFEDEVVELNGGHLTLCRNRLQIAIMRKLLSNKYNDNTYECAQSFFEDKKDIKNKIKYIGI